MSFSDRSFMKFFYIVIGFLVTLAVLAIVLANVLGGASKKDEQYFRNLKDDALLMTAGNTVQLDEVVVASAAHNASMGDAAATQSGEEIYQASCSACHATGAAGAPKLETAAWEPRVAQGFDTLIDHAINGFNNVMPARGGNPSLSDEDIKKTVAYMVTQAGHESIVPADLLAGEDHAEASAQENEAETVAAENQEVVAAQAETEAAPENETPASSETPAEDVVAAAQEAAEQSPVEPAVAEAEATTSGDSPLLAADLSVGQNTYNTACMACHMTGAAGAPKLEAAAWESRVAQGHEVLIDHALHGFNAMPAKGGNPTLSDEQVTAAIAYMLDQTGLLH